MEFLEDFNRPPYIVAENRRNLSYSTCSIYHKEVGKMKKLLDGIVRELLEGDALRNLIGIAKQGGGRGGRGRGSGQGGGSGGGR